MAVRNPTHHTGSSDSMQFVGVGVDYHPSSLSLPIMAVGKFRTMCYSYEIWNEPSTSIRVKIEHLCCGIHGAILLSILLKEWPNGQYVLGV